MNEKLRHIKGPVVVTITGGESVGKTLLTDWLETRLKKEGVDVHVQKEHIPNMPQRSARRYHTKRIAEATVVIRDLT
jgi:thymidylate kinase